MKFDLFTAKAPPLFGLDISSSSVKMLELADNGNGSYRVERYAIEPLPRDCVVDGNINNLEAVTDAVKRAHARMGTRTRHVAMAVPSGAVISKKIIVPAALREEELEPQLARDPLAVATHIVQCRVPIQLRLAQTEHVQVRAVQHEESMGHGGPWQHSRHSEDAPGASFRNGNMFRYVVA